MVRRFINMNINEIKQLTKGKQYNFLRDNEHLGKNIVLLGVTGSHGTGVNTKNSVVQLIQKEKSYLERILRKLKINQQILLFILSLNWFAF